MEKNLSTIETIWEKLQDHSGTIAYAEIQDLIGTISVGNNGRIECTSFPAYAHYEEYYLWEILCLCLKKNILTMDLTRIKLELSGDSDFPYCIHTILRQKSFRTLNLLSLRRSLPLDFWKLCAHYSVQDGQLNWKHVITVSPQNEAILNYHRLKGIGQAARAEQSDILEVRQLYLWNQQLLQLPLELAYLHNLERLEIWNNPIQEIPQSFQQLSNLKDIILSKDQKSLVPAIQKYLPHTTIGWV